MSRSIPIKPFQPLPPLVRMEQLPDTPSKLNRPITSKNATDNDSNGTETATMTSDDWMMLSPTNHCVTLSVTNQSGLSHTNTSMENDTDHNHHDLWNHPLMMMMEDDDDDDDQHTSNNDIQQYYNNPTSDVARHTGSGTIKRVSLDASDGYDMDVVAVDTSDDCFHMVVGDEHHDEFVFMDGLEHDPLLTLTGTSHDNHNIHDDDDDGQLVVPYNRIASTDIAEPNNTVSNPNHPYDDNNDGDHDPWTEAAAEAAFQMTNDEQDMMVFEIDQSFLFKMNGHTVGTESTMASSYSSVSPDLLSVTAPGDSNNTVPPFFTSQQFQERCKLLAESMRASQLSRQCLSLQENIKLRANLAKVLKDIENSSAKVQRHCLSQQISSQQTELLSEPTDSESPTNTAIDTVDSVSTVNVDDEKTNDHSTVLSPSAVVQTTE